MPKSPLYTLAWSPQRMTYDLYQTRNREVLPLVPDSPTWVVWLEGISSFAFRGKQGRYTARKETRSRGGYWYAYLTRKGHLHKKYIGKTSQITLARLEFLAEVLMVETPLDTTYEPQPIPQPLTAPPSISSTDDAASPSPHPIPSQDNSSLHPLLVTKLYQPRPRAQLVARPHLLERLQRSVETPLTLISAPAGFGKTTVLAQWLSECNVPATWLSLEPEDNDPARFLPYLIAALQTLDPQLGTEALALLWTPQPPPPETVLALLMNDVMHHRDQDLILVLDDYHTITAEPLQRGMTFFLDHLPPQFHLILSTRIDPPLPLARLRARGHLLEVRAPDLLFAYSETSDFLHLIMRLTLSHEAVQTLQQRTEGWIAGLQLAALSLQGRTHADRFMEDFTGTHRFVQDYLSKEVLAQQSQTVQTFLLCTSLLNHLSGPLCDAVTGQKNSQRMLEWLEKANLFVVELDERRGWYRYHHLFAEALQNHLFQREPFIVPLLHRRASEWYAQHELPFEAVRHALAIPDEEWAIQLLEPIVIPYAFSGQRSTVIKWLNELSVESMRAHPLLCTYYAALLMLTNQFRAAQIRLREAETGMKEEMPAEQVRMIQGYGFTVRSTLAFFCGDLHHAIPFAHL